MHSIKRGSRSFARSIVSEKLLCRWVAPPAGRVAQIFIGTEARLGIREPSAKTPADMGYFAVQMWLTVRYLQIYKVSQCVAVTDDNYDILYSFGNSARKFLEMYLYFKYPTNEDLLPKLKRFFDPEDVPPILINRLLNEGSHGPTPENSLRTEIDPETIPVAKKILQLLQKDSEQYSAFMESIS